MFALVEGPRGPVQVFNVMLDYPMHGSGVRQAQVRELAAFVAEVQSRDTSLLCVVTSMPGPDSDEDSAAQWS